MPRAIKLITIFHILPTEETPDEHRGQGPAQRGLAVDASGA